jgi:lysophospholipase L1-like esterase
MDVKKFAKNLRISLGMSLLLLLFIEIFIRVFLHQVQPQDCDSRMILDNVYANSCGLKPNAAGKFFGHLLHSDELGGRKMRKPFSKKKKTWLHLGDSVTMGVGVDDDSTFVARMAEKIDSVNMLNLSLIGYSVHDYENVIRTLLMEKHNALNIEHISLYWCLNDIYNIPLGHAPSKFDQAKDFMRSNYLTYVCLKGVFFNREKFYYEHDAAYYNESGAEQDSAINALHKIKALCAAAHVKLDIKLLPYQYQYVDEIGLITFREQQNFKTSFDYYKLYLGVPADSSRPETMTLLSDAFMQDNKDISEDYLFGDGIHFSNQGHARMANYLLYGN